MNLQDLLNSEMDLGSLAALARQGLAWWLDELATLLPPAWRARLSSRPRVLAEQVTPGVWRYWKDGRPVDRDATLSDTAVGLLLPSSAVLAREVRVPRMPAADVRRMLSLDIDRLSPLSPDLIHFDMEIVDRDADDGVQRVLVGVTAREDAGSLLRAAAAEGLTPVALGGRAEGDPATMRFNFLPAAEAVAGAPRKSRVRLYSWTAVAGLMLLNMIVLVARDVVDVQRLKSQAEAQAPIVNTVLALRRRVGAEERRRADMIARGQRSEPLRLLDTLSQAVPPTAWVQHLEWNGQTLRLVGFRKPETDMVAALRGSGAFTNVRMLGAEAGSSQTATVPFDVTAEARPAAPGPMAGSRP